MLTRSAKAKGKRLEKWVASKILEAYPTLTNEDVRITVGAETGADIKLSKKAKEVFDYSIECKNRESLKTVYGFYEQACGKEGCPLVIIKMNHMPPLAILDAEEVFKLIKNAKK